MEEDVLNIQQYKGRTKLRIRENTAKPIAHKSLHLVRLHFLIGLDTWHVYSTGFLLSLCNGKRGSSPDAQIVCCSQYHHQRSKSVFSAQWFLLKKIQDRAGSFNLCWWGTWLQSFWRQIDKKCRQKYQIKTLRAFVTRHWVELNSRKHVLQLVVVCQVALFPLISLTSITLFTAI